MKQHPNVRKLAFIGWNRETFPSKKERREQVDRIKQAVTATVKRWEGRVTEIRDDYRDLTGKDYCDGFYDGDLGVQAEFRDEESAAAARKEIVETWQVYGVATAIRKDGHLVTDEGSTIMDDRVIQADGTVIFRDDQDADNEGQNAEEDTE